MFKSLTNKLTEVLSIDRSTLNSYLKATWVDYKADKTSDNLKCIILNSWITNTSEISLKEIQPLLPTGWTCQEADFFVDDTPMLMGEFKIKIEDLKKAPKGILIHRKGGNAVDVLENL